MPRKLSLLAMAWSCHYFAYIFISCLDYWGSLVIVLSSSRLASPIPPSLALKYKSDYVTSYLKSFDDFSAHRIKSTALIMTANTLYNQVPLDHFSFIACPLIVLTLSSGASNTNSSVTSLAPPWFCVKADANLSLNSFSALPLLPPQNSTHPSRSLIFENVPNSSYS